MALQAGIARACINPPLDIPNGMWVAQKHVRAEGLDMNLYATALVLADGDLRVALVDLDLCLLLDPFISTIRNCVCESTGIPERNTLPFCSHSHAGPLTFDFYRGEGENRVRIYMEMLPHLIAGAAARAAASLRPVQVAAGLGRSHIGINRDLRLPDGRFLVGCNPEGFCDPEVGVIRLDTVDGQPLACIVNYACHPTILGPGNRLISPDYPGSVRKIVEQVTGATCFFLQGAAGNVGPTETFVSDAGVARKLGTQLGLEASRVFLTLNTRPTERRLRNVVQSGAALADYEDIPTAIPQPHLALLQDFVDLPTRSPFSEVYEKAPERLAQTEAEIAELTSMHADPQQIATVQQRLTREQLRVNELRSYKGRKTLPIETYAVRLGEAAIVTISGEPYSEIGAMIKSRSPFTGKTLFAGYEGGYTMYLPTADVFHRQPPPMEVDNSPFAPEAAAIATEHLVHLLGSLADKSKTTTD